MQNDLFQTATSSQPDTPVSHSVSPGSSEARQMTAISGQKYLPLCKQSGQIGAFSKMFLDTSVWASTKCYLTWKIRLVTQSKHFVLELCPSTPPTADNESGLLQQMWATPLAQEAKHADVTQWELATDHMATKNSLRVQAAKSMWPTPKATDGSKGSRTVEGALKEMRRGKNKDLGMMTALWPTPTARDHKGGYQGGRIRNGKVSMDTLDVAVQHTDNQQKTGGQLNPQWVEWLMGYPRGWTDLTDGSESQPISQE